MDGGVWWAAVHGVVKSWTWLSDFTFSFHFHALEKEMATHSSVLAWRIPGMAEPVGLPSMGSHRVGHDWSDLAAAAAEACSTYKNNTCKTSLSGPVVESTHQCRGQRLDPWSRKTPHAMEQQTHVPQLLRPSAATTEAHSPQSPFSAPRSHHSEKPMHHKQKAAYARCN